MFLLNSCFLTGKLPNSSLKVIVVPLSLATDSTLLNKGNQNNKNIDNILFFKVFIYPLIAVPSFPLKIQ